SLMPTTGLKSAFERAGSCTSQMRMLPLVPGTSIAPNAVVNSATSFYEGYVGHEPFHERKGDHWVGDAASLGSSAAKASALRTGLAGLPRRWCRQSRQAVELSRTSPSPPRCPASPRAAGGPARRGSQT